MYLLFPVPDIQTYIKCDRNILQYNIYLQIKRSYTQIIHSMIMLMKMLMLMKNDNANEDANANEEWLC